MVRLTVVMKATAREAPRLLEALRYLMVRTRLEAGCVECSAWSDEEGTVHYAESWVDEAHIQRRVASDRFVPLLGILESARHPPQVQFDFVSASRGLDYVAEVRKAAPPGGRQAHQ
jgi:quinol monooxygenase YgiN